MAEKYGINVSAFARNITNEALENRDSFIFHEEEGYDSGLLGYHKPLTHTMYANFRLVDVVGTMFDLQYRARSKWDASQWEAYTRIVLMAFRDYVATGVGRHSYSLYRAKGNIESAASDLYKLNGTSIAWDDDSLARLGVIVQFIKDAIEILDSKAIPEDLRIRVRDERHLRDTFYDHLAEMIFKVILDASAVKTPRQECWWVQHNSVWGELFNFGQVDGRAGRIVKFKARRLLYNEILRMNRFPNFKGSRILAFCLNVMGLAEKSQGYDKDSKALHKAVLAWTRKNFALLHAKNSRVAVDCLVAELSYDTAANRLVRTIPAEGLRTKPSYVYLYLDPAPAPQVNNP